MTGYNWPWQYSFPPFFTLQPNSDTRKKQLEAWKSLILNYHKTNKIYTLDVTESQEGELFNNTQINRKLPIDAIYTILDELQQRGNIEWLDKGKKRCYIYWRTPEEWGQQIYKWAVNNGMTNSVCTFYEITQGDDTSEEEFHGLDEGVLTRALKALEGEKKAEIMDFDGSSGVKFF